MSVASVWPSRTTRRPASSRCTGSGRPSAPLSAESPQTVLDGAEARGRGHVGNLPVQIGVRYLLFTLRCHTAGMALESVPLSSAPDSALSEPFDVEPPYVPDTTALAAVEKYDDRFLDREISWLHFNQRVLELAEDPDLPLLERVRFLAIFASNLDEFFMVRVAGLKRRIAAGVAVRAASGLLPREVLEEIWAGTRELMERHARLFRDELVPALLDEGIELVRWADLDREEQKACKRLFRDRVFPVLTPLAVDPAHPFPYISGLSLNLAVLVRNPKTGKEHFARVKVPPIFSRFVPARQPAVRAARGRHRRAPQAAVPGHGGARGARVPGDPQRGPRRRGGRRREPARRAREGAAAAPVRPAGAARGRGVDLAGRARAADLRARRLRGGGVPAAGPAGPDRAARIADLAREDLRYPAFIPTTHRELAEVESAAPVDVFKATSRHDVLLHHPYDSFATSVQRFIEQAAADPHVLAIKQTLYRTSGDSPIIDALVDAAESGKQVLVIVEIKARFDEQANIRWARKLEQAGCHVVYGLVGLKTHCKLAMVVRDEPEGIRRYTHIGTGNYNPKTSRLYEDLGIITTDERIGEDVAHLFNNLSGYSRNASYDDLLVAPDSVRTGLLDQIHHEIAHHRAGRPALIRFKANSIVDEAVIDALYLASQEGVPVQLLIRGICALRPGVPGLSESIEVRSILGRFLEHSRVFWFENGGEPVAWIGSADMMHRNLDRRVEVLVRVPGDDNLEEIREPARPGLRRGHRGLAARQRR